MIKFPEYYAYALAFRSKLEELIKESNYKN